MNAASIAKATTTTIHFQSVRARRLRRLLLLGLLDRLEECPSRFGSSRGMFIPRTG